MGKRGRLIGEQEGGGEGEVKGCKQRGRGYISHTLRYREGRSGSPVTQSDMFAIESELEPIFDTVHCGFGRFETLESDFVIHFGSGGVIMRNEEDDFLVRFE